MTGLGGKETGGDRSEMVREELAWREKDQTTRNESRTGMEKERMGGNR